MSSMNFKIKKYWLTFLSSILAGCQSHFALNLSSENSSGLISMIEITQPIAVSAGSTRVFLQKGEIVRNFDHYQPNCNLEVRRLDYENMQLIPAGKYPVTGASVFSEEVVNNYKKQSIQVAANGAISLAGLFDSNSSSGIYRSIHFHLAGDDTNVSRLTCRGAYDIPVNALLPKIGEISEAVGQYIKIYFRPGKSTL